MKQLFFYLLLFGFVQQATAQVDLQCNGRDKHAIYFTSGLTNIYRIDSLDTSPSNPKLVTDTIPAGSVGLSINNDLNGGSGKLTMYDVAGNVYYYFNGSAWVNTTFNSGAGNPGGGTAHIFNLDGIGGYVYSYNGTGAATQVASNLHTAAGGVFDVTADSADNFYLFYTDLNLIVAFNQTGVPIDTFTTTGNTHVAGPGLALLGNRVYYIDVAWDLYEGIKTGKNVHFTKIKALSSFSPVYDIAACPYAGIPLAVFKDLQAPHFAMYPNPANNEVVIKLNNTAQLKIYDCLGKVKLSASTVGQTAYNFSVNGWAPGIYFVTATSAQGKTAFLKLMVR